MSADLDEIRRLPIKEVAARLGLKVLRGNKAMCFSGHDKRTPSLSFVPSKNIWKCFGCGLKGDTIALAMNVLDRDFRGVLEWFAMEFRVDLGREGSQRSYRRRAKLATQNRIEPRALLPTPDDEQKFFPDAELYTWFVGKCGAVSEVVGLSYLRDHGIPLEIANRFGVRELRNPGHALRRLTERFGAERVFRSGLAWGERGSPKSLIWTSYTLLFPFCVNGIISFVQGRRFKKEPKYLNPRGIAKPLYNIDRLRLLPLGSAIHICEGVPDTLALEAHGLSAIGILGATSFRPEWVDYFMRYDVVLMPDGDKGGETFWRIVSSLFRARGKTITTVHLPSGKDVADVIGEIRGTK